VSLTGIEKRAVAAVSVGMFCVQLDFFALSLALPRMAVDLGETTTNMQWVLSAYMIAIGAALIPAGRLGDLRGHRRVVVAGLLVFGISSLVCGLASSYPLVIVFRSLQGLGAAALLTVSVAAITNAVSSTNRAVAIGTLFGAANVGTALGPFIGGLLTEQLSWRFVFLLNVPLAAAAVICCLLWLPRAERSGAPVRIDWLGLVLVAAGVVALAYAADRAGDWGWLSWRFLGCLAVAAVAFVVFVVVERRVRDPLVDLALFRNRDFDLITIGGTVANIVYAVVVLSTTIYLQDARGLSPVVAGLVFLAPSVAVTLSGPLAGRLAAWRPVTVLIPCALLFGGVTLLAVSAVDLWGLYVPLLGITGFALGLGWALPNIGTQAAVDPSRAGEAAGVSLTALVTMGGVAIAVSGTLIELGGSDPAGVATATKDLLRGAAVLAVVAGGVLLALTRLSRRSERGLEPSSASGSDR
jgi:EmrB/QacA subfamily drug resistance transporter